MEKVNRDPKKTQKRKKQGNHTEKPHQGVDEGKMGQKPRERCGQRDGDRSLAEACQHLL